MWWLIGEYTQELTVAYREAAAELLLAGARERSALVEALFTGGIPDRDTLWEAAKMLRLPWEGVFVVVAAEAPGLAQEGLPQVEALLAARGIGSAWRLHPDIQTGVVSLRRQDALPVLLEHLGSGARARAGVSPVYHALSDTPRALHYARLVLGSLPAGVPAVAQFEQTRCACWPPPPRTPLASWCARCSDRSRPACPGPVEPAEHPAGMVRRRRLGRRDRQADLLPPQHRAVPAATVAGAHRPIPEDPRAVAELLAALDALRLTRGASW